jgi:hypothetical protein
LVLTTLILLAALITLHELLCFVLQAFELAHNCLPPEGRLSTAVSRCRRQPPARCRYPRMLA